MGGALADNLRANANAVHKGRAGTHSSVYLGIMRVPFALLVILLLPACADPIQPAIPDLEALSSRLESLRRQHDIPALSVGLIQVDGTTWTVGLGRALALGSASSTTAGPPTPESVFHLASITKTFASAVVLQLAEEGKLSLDDNVSNYGIVLNNSSDVRVWHLMSHTSEGVPGQQFRYNGDRFALLDRVVLGASGMTFAE
jgi:CubicO group peptidase (beta-lactamase class C family)